LQNHPANVGPVPVDSEVEFAEIIEVRQRERVRRVAWSSSGDQPPRALGYRTYRRGLIIRPFALGRSFTEKGGATGLVIVSPERLKKKDLVDTSHLLRVTGLPLLGLITYSHSGSIRPRLRATRPRLRLRAAWPRSRAAWATPPQERSGP